MPSNKLQKVSSNKVGCRKFRRTKFGLESSDEERKKERGLATFLPKWPEETWAESSAFDYATYFV